MRMDGVALPIVRPPRGQGDSDVHEIGIIKQFAFSSEHQVCGGDVWCVG